MTRARTALAYCTLLIVAWAVLHPFIGADLDIEATRGGRLSPFETAAVSWNLWMLQWLPFLLTPGILAPAMVAIRWAVMPDRTTVPVEPTSAAVDEIWAWVGWVLASFAVGGVALLLRCLGLPLRLFSVAAPLIFASSWSSAAALHYALKLQWQREHTHQSRIRPLYLAAGATLVSAVFLAVPVVVAIPMWVAWSAGRDGSESASEKLASV